MILTERLRLRHATVDDAPSLFLAMSDPEVMRYWSTEPHPSVEDTASFVRRMMHGYVDGSGPDDFVVERDGVVVGKAGFWRASELGFLLRRDQHGQGIAREALQALVAHGFGPRAFTELHAEVDPENRRCLRLLTGLGFRVLRHVPRTLELRGEWRDSLELALGFTDWRRP